MNREGWVHNLFRPLAFGAMVGCIALSLVDLVRLFVPNWHGAYIVVGCFLAAVEANYSYRLIRARNLRGGDLVRFRAFEIALFFVLLRIGSMIGVSWANVWADLRAWPREPWRLFDLEIIYAFLLTLLSWAASTRTTYDLQRIGEPRVREKYYVHPVDALTSRFFWGGAMLLWIAGVTRIGVSAVLNLSHPSVPGLVLNVLLYFALGLAMLGQIQYARLSQRWRKEEIDVPKELSHHWVRYTVLFLGLTGLVAFLLPTGYTLPLLDIISIIIGAIFYVFNLIFQLGILILFLMLSPLARLFGADLERQPFDSVSRLQLPRLTGGGGGSAPGWLEIVRSAVFWTVALAVLVYVVRSYLRDRPELIEALTALRPFRAVRAMLLRIWGQLTELAGAARDRMPIQVRLRRRGTGADQSSGKNSFRFLRLLRLSRRERTVYYYLSIVRRATRQGYPRRPSQTPYEYDDQLGPSMSEAEQEMSRLTEAFVETRYSTHQIDRAQERRVRADFERVRAALRSLKQRSGADEGSETEPA